MKKVITILRATLVICIIISTFILCYTLGKVVIQDAKKKRLRDSLEVEVFKKILQK